MTDKSSRKERVFGEDLNDQSPRMSGRGAVKDAKSLASSSINPINGAIGKGQGPVRNIQNER